MHVQLRQTNVLLIDSRISRCSLVPPSTWHPTSSLSILTEMERQYSAPRHDQIKTAASSSKRPVSVHEGLKNKISSTHALDTTAQLLFVETHALLASKFVNNVKGHNTNFESHHMAKYLLLSGKHHAIEHFHNLTVRRMASYCAHESIIAPLPC